VRDLHYTKCYFCINYSRLRATSSVQ